MDQYELIRTSQRVYKKSIRQIAKETGHARNTVRKALSGQEPKYHRNYIEARRLKRAPLVASNAEGFTRPCKS